MSSPSAPPQIHLRPVTAETWREVADLAPQDAQRQFVPALAARYLLLSTMEDTWHSLGAYAGDEAVAHVMWGVDDDESRWIGGLLVDAAHQGRGVGRAVMLAVIGFLLEQGTFPIRLTCHPDNTAGQSLFASLGFRPNGEWDEEEQVLDMLR